MTENMPDRIGPSVIWVRKNPNTWSSCRMRPPFTDIKYVRADSVKNHGQDAQLTAGKVFYALITLILLWAAAGTATAYISHRLRMIEIKETNEPFEKSIRCLNERL